MNRFRLAWLPVFALLGAGFLSLSSLTGCRMIEGTHRMRDYGMRAEYDTRVDRLVFFGPRGHFNLLYSVNLEAMPSESGDYTFFGGMYSWISPQGQWTDGDGNLRDWPPDPAMDRGPSVVTHHGRKNLTATNPPTRTGLVETKSFELVPGGLRVTHQLMNESEVTQPVGIWSNTAVWPRGWIAVRKPTDGSAIRFNHDEAASLWDHMSKEDGNWIRVKTRRHQAGYKGPRNDLKAFVPTPYPVIAIWRRGYWLLRIGDTADEFGTLANVGESSVEIYLNYGMKLFEAELLGPIVDLDPGQTMEFHEQWVVIPSMRPDTRVLDEALAARRPGWFGDVVAETVIEPDPEPAVEDADAPAPAQDDVDEKARPLIPVRPVEEQADDPETEEPEIDVDEPADLPDKPAV